MPDGKLPPAERFSERVTDYIRTRPAYPTAVADRLANWAELTSESAVADIGSGTGISTESFLRFGCTVYAIEPNPAMRSGAEGRLGSLPNFVSVAGSAEATTLPDASVDFVVAAQSFHWFHPTKTHDEFFRILRRPGRAAVMWNTRLTDATPFLRDYEQLLLEFGTDYREVNHAEMDRSVLHDLFAPEGHDYFSAKNAQSFDFSGLAGRLRSSSYAPIPGQANYEPMMKRLAELFAKHNRRGRVEFKYLTEVFYGYVTARSAA